MHPSPRHSSHLGLLAQCGEQHFQSGNIKMREIQFFIDISKKEEEEEEDDTN